MSERVQRAVLVLLVLLVALIRVEQCLHKPVKTADLVRHLVYGHLVRAGGWQVAGVELAAVDDRYRTVPWSGRPYNYPPVALAFFTLLGGLSSTLFGARLALTLVEGLCAVLVARITESRWLGLLYWSLPVSIWWVSREGQFEPLQNLFVLLAVLLVRRGSPVAAAALSLAIQVKVTALVLLPFLIWELVRRHRVWPALAWLAAGLLPTGLLQLQLPLVQTVLHSSAPLRFNGYFWNPFDRAMFGLLPEWQVWTNTITTGGLLLVLVVWAWRSRQPEQCVAACLFLVFLKVHVNVLPWYLVLLPSFLVPLRSPRLLLGIFLLLPLCEPSALRCLLAGPIGYTEGRYYQSFSVHQEIGGQVPLPPGPPRRGR